MRASRVGAGAGVSYIVALLLAGWRKGPLLCGKSVVWVRFGGWMCLSEAGEKAEGVAPCFVYVSYRRDETEVSFQDRGDSLADKGKAGGSA